MRKQKRIKIDDKEITVKELTVAEIMEIWEGIGGKGDLKTLKDYALKYMDRVTDVTLDDLCKMAPSEIKLVYDAFMEVNQDFFALAQLLGLGEFLKSLKSAMLTDLSAMFVGLFAQGMSGSGITDGPSS